MKTRFEISPNVTQQKAIKSLMEERYSAILVGEIWFNRNTVKIPTVGKVRIRSITDGNRFKKITSVKLSVLRNRIYATVDGY